MEKLVELIKRHQLVAYFILTYAFSWALWLIAQPLYLGGNRIVAPLISLGIFSPALVSIGLSALIKPHPRQGSRRTAVVAFVIAWILASVIFIQYLILLDEMALTTRLVVVCMITAFLPAFVVSAIFSTIPGVSALLQTYRQPRGAFGYYLLAVVIFPVIWFLGYALSRLMGMEVPVSNYPASGFELFGLALLFFLYNCAYSALSEEPGWRGFALPRLQARFSPLVSSLILGVIWAFWHAPTRFGGIEAKNLSVTLVDWVLIVLVTVILTWFFNRTKGSILVTAILHPAMNMTGNFLTGSLGMVFLLLVFLVFVIVLDRMWKRLPADHPAIYQASANPA
jgi:uncharacterized protein